MNRAALLPLLLALSLLVPACGERPRPLPLRTVPFTDVNPYGANVFLEREVEEWKMRRELQMMKDAGIGFVKQEIPWFEIEPERKGEFVDTKFNKASWDKYDKRINLINEFGLQAILRLDAPPNWTRKDNSLPQAPPDNFADYGDFVYTVVSHLRSKGIRYYQIWNEPNIYPEWGNKPPDPAGYVRLLKVGYQRAKEADPNAVILSAPLAITLERSSRNMSDLDFLSGMYAAGAKDYFDILSANAYGLSLPPTDPPDPQKLNFQRVTLQRTIMENNGDSAKPVWFDEFGWNSSPADMSVDKLIWGRVTEQQQSDYTRDAIRMARKQWPWLGVINLWYFRQDGTTYGPSDSAYYFRLVNPDFSPTPLYAEIAREAPPLRLAQPGEYEETDPALQPSDDGKISGNWELRLDPQASGRTFLASNKPRATMLITFRGTSIRLKTITAPNAGVVYISIDGSSTMPNKLKRNNQGIAVLDLYTPQKQYHQDQLIADGLSFDKHVLQVTVSGLKNAASQDAFAFVDGFVVGA
jgi:polysaccharide biosynthesis protein PslG